MRIRLRVEGTAWQHFFPQQFFFRFNSVLELAYDNAIDYPMLWKYLAEIITPVILKDLFTLSDLKPLILEHLIPVGKAAALFAEILLITKELTVSINTIAKYGKYSEILLILRSSF